MTFGGTAWFDWVTFTGHAQFVGAVFEGDSRFDKAEFRTAQFDQAAFSGAAEFVGTTFAGTAQFDRAAFSGAAQFLGTTFAGYAQFLGTTFARAAQFGNAAFDGMASFDQASFAGDAHFVGTGFSGAVQFDMATFGGLRALFNEATFSGDARFVGATFTGDVRFDRATFDLAVLDFNQVVALTVSFHRARFNCTIDGIWAARAVSFEEARFAEPVTIRLLCQNLILSNVELRAGGTLQVRGEIDATAATFGDRTTLADPGNEDRLRELLGPVRRTFGSPVAAEENRWEVLIESVLDVVAASASVTSLRRATVADLELSAVDLTDCQFAGAHGLDKMRIDSACILPTTPASIGFRRPIRFTRRTVIAEERIWRERHATWETGSDPANPTVTDDGTPAAPIVAGIYRSLRKGLEDARNEPGAADFYYGEMEMRRLARRAPSPTGPKPSLAETWLLTGYWALAGYGLRAWRALAAITALILVGSVVFATVGVQDPPGSTSQLSQVDLATGTVEYTQVPRPAFTWPDAVELAARSSVALLRNPSGAPALTGIGTAVDIALRLLVPALLALAVLAIRGRTKR